MRSTFDLVMSTPFVFSVKNDQPGINNRLTILASSLAEHSSDIPLMKTHIIPLST
jgi:hypothetical protein